jgi:glycosyltransferase involved in cell wall biosynthesis
MFALQVAIMKAKGGVFTSLFHYARMWRANGVRSACLYRGAGADQLRAAGVDVIEAPDTFQSPLFRFSPEFARLRAEIRRRGGDPECVMAHSDRALPVMHAMFPRATLLTRCHTDKTKHKRAAHLIVTLNERQHALVKSELPHARVRMLGNPFAPAADEPAPRQETAPNGRVRFNFVGRVEPVKEALTLMRAFESADLLESTQLRIIGAGSQDDEIRSAAARSARAVEQSGWLQHPFSHFDRGDILVLPSRWESYSWVIREALFFGIPIIASDIHVHRDALGDGAFGWLFEVGDADDLKTQLELAQTRVDDLRTMAGAGREALLARYGAVPFWRALAAEISAARSAR